MKLKAPPGVGDPCVAGAAVVPRDGMYEVEPEVGALLIECFGFVALEAERKPAPTRAVSRRKAPAKKA